jgi:hypothetical protein
MRPHSEDSVTEERIDDRLRQLPVPVSFFSVLVSDRRDILCAID